MIIISPRMLSRIWRKASVMLRPRLAPILFSRQVQPAYICLPSKWSGWQELHLRPPRSERGRLLLTLHPEKWLPDLDSHQDKRLNRPPCYFDTTWQWRSRQDLHPHSSRRQRVAFLFSYESKVLESPQSQFKNQKSKMEKWWEALVTLQFVASDFVL